MNIYCDESGGLSAGAMTMAAVAIASDDADSLLERFRVVTGLRGEMKGSRISLPERGLFFELFERFQGRALVVEARRGTIAGGTVDRLLYAALLEQAVAALLPETGGCAQVVIDDGRYDPATLAPIRADIATLIGPCGSARLADSRRSAGVQIADVVANSIFNIAVGSNRAARIDAIVAPFRASGRIDVRPLQAATSAG